MRPSPGPRFSEPHRNVSRPLPDLSFQQDRFNSLANQPHPRAFRFLKSPTGVASWATPLILLEFSLRSGSAAFVSTITHIFASNASSPALLCFRFFAVIPSRISLILSSVTSDRSSAAWAWPIATPAGNPHAQAESNASKRCPVALRPQPSPETPQSSPPARAPLSRGPLSSYPA